MAQLAIGDDTKTELRRLADDQGELLGLTSPLSFDKFIQMMMAHWKVSHSEPEEEG